MAMSRDDLRNTIAPFDGSGDVNMWFKKVRLVAKMKRMKDLSDLVPLYLDGQAFQIYDELSECEKEDGEKIEAALRAAFEIDRFTALEKLLCRKWTYGEPADTFLSDLRHLAKLAAIEDEEFIRGAFVIGLPADISQQLRSSAKITTAKLSAVCEQARILLRQKMSRETAAAATPTPAIEGHRPPRRKQQPAAQFRPERGASDGTRRCYVCEGDHLARVCPMRADRRKPTCWKCGEPGHIAAVCSGNGSGEERPAQPSSPRR